MGLGAIGAQIAHAITVFGYPVVGWSRTAKQIDGVRCYAGASGLNAFLAQTNILVNVLPLTRETKDLLNARLFTYQDFALLAEKPELKQSKNDGLLAQYVAPLEQRGHDLRDLHEALRPLVLGRAASSTIAARAIEEGMRTLRVDGWRKVRGAVTTIEEVLRVTRGG